MLYEVKTIGFSFDKDDIWLKVAYLGPRKSRPPRLPESARNSEFRTIDSIRRRSQRSLPIPARNPLFALIFCISSPRRSIVKRDRSTVWVISHAALSLELSRDVCDDRIC